MSRRSRLALAVVAVVGAAALWALTATQVSIPGHEARGLTTGFRPGRWDARFLIARNAAAVVLPHAARVTLSLSGPATVTLGGHGASAEARLEGSAAQPVVSRVGDDGRLDVRSDGIVRLHGLTLEREGRRPAAHLGLVLAAMGLGLFFAARGRILAAAASLVAILAATATDAFAFTVVRTEATHLRPFLAIWGLCGLLLVTAWAGRVRRPAPVSRLPLVFGVLVGVASALQVLLLPQPLLIGDPGAYHDMGGRFASAFRGGIGPDGLADAVVELRPYGGLVFTGLVYGALRAFHDSLTTIYLAQAIAMGLAAAFLVRAALRLGGARLATVTGAVAALYPTFPILCGIVQPEPFILMAWTWAADALLAGSEDGGFRRDIGPGLAFALGLALHPQGIWFLLAAVVLVVGPWWLFWERRSSRRRLAAFALGLLPVALVTASGEAYARPVAQVLDERYGFWAYTARVPLGFWLFVDTDGWQGPMRIEQTRYAMAFRETVGDSAGAARRLLFTAEFVAENARDSLRTVLRNLHRLLHVPDNPFRRAFILPYALQVPWHRALVVLFVIAAPLVVRAGAASTLVPVAILCVTYPLYHVFNKYAVPGTPFLLLGAGFAIDRLLRDRPRLLLLALGLAALGATVPASSLAFAGVPAAVAGAVLRLLHLGGLAWAGVEAARLWAQDGRAQAVLGVGTTALLLATFAAGWDDPSWRRFDVPADGAYQAIVPGPGALEDLARAAEAYLVLDLHVPDGDPSDLRLAFDSGLAIPGSALQPTMPSFGLATLRGGRDPRSFPQWWRLPWQKEMVRDGRIGLTLSADPETRLYGDLDVSGEGPRRHGLSLGYWPAASVYRLMHDGEYRLAVRQLMDAAERSSRRGPAPLPGTFGVRLVRLDDDAGGTSWSTEGAPGGPRVVAVWAEAGRNVEADLMVMGGPALRFGLGGPGPWTSSGAELRHVATGDFAGWYLLRLDHAASGSLEIRVRPRQALSSAPKYFTPDASRTGPPVPADWAGLPVSLPTWVHESRESPRWRPLAVY